MPIAYCKCGRAIESSGRGRPPKTCEFCREEEENRRAQRPVKTVAKLPESVQNIYEGGYEQEESDILDNIDSIGVCANEGCDNPLPPHSGRGRRPKYCEQCKKNRVSQAPTMQRASRRNVENTKSKCNTPGCYTPITEGMFCEYCKATPETKDEWASILCAVQGCSNNIHVLQKNITDQRNLCCYHTDVEAQAGGKESTCTNCNRVFRYTTEVAPVFCEYCTAKENFTFVSHASTEGQDFIARIAQLLSYHYDKPISAVALNRFCQSFTMDTLPKTESEPSESE